MSATLRRVVPAALSVVLLLGAGACGEETPATESTPAAERLDAVSITGEVGTIPEVEFSERMEADSAEEETVVTGDGPAVEDGGSALVQFWIGNGFTQQKAVSSYDDAKAQIFTLNDDLNPIFADALEGATAGSRIAITASAAEAFGETGNASIGIGNEDSVLIILDVLSLVADAPSGTDAPAPDWMPEIVQTDGNPSSFDFAGVPEPTGRFRKATLVDGDGERVRKGQTVAVRYLGQVYGGDAPFDQNYTTAPITFGIGVGQVIEGWDKQVVGSDVGSRIVIEVPPKLGYGEAGNEAAGIAGTDTLFFVIDILAAG